MHPANARSSVWRGCPALPASSRRRMQWFIACLNMTGGRRIVFSGKRIFTHCAVFASEPENVRFPCERSRYELFDGGFLPLCEGAGNDFPVGCPCSSTISRYSMSVLLCEILSSVFKDCGNCVAMKQSDCTSMNGKNLLLPLHHIIVYGAGRYKKQLITCVLPFAGNIREGVFHV